MWIHGSQRIFPRYRHVIAEQASGASGHNDDAAEEAQL